MRPQSITIALVAIAVLLLSLGCDKLNPSGPSDRLPTIESFRADTLTPKVNANVVIEFENRDSQAVCRLTSNIGNNPGDVPATGSKPWAFPSVGVWVITLNCRNDAGAREAKLQFTVVP